jgi:hypothetical protein
MVETHSTPKGPLHCKRCQHIGQTLRNGVLASTCVSCSDVLLSLVGVTPKKHLMSCSCGGNGILNDRRCSKWKEAKPAANWGKDPRRKRKVPPRVWLPSNQLHLHSLLKRRKWSWGGTTFLLGSRGQESGYSVSNAQFIRRGQAERAAGCPRRKNKCKAAGPELRMVETNPPSWKPADSVPQCFSYLSIG